MSDVIITESHGEWIWQCRTCEIGGAATKFHVGAPSATWHTCQLPWCALRRGHEGDHALEAPPGMRPEPVDGCSTMIA